MRRTITAVIALCALAASVSALPAPIAFYSADSSLRLLRDSVSGRTAPVPASASIVAGGPQGSYIALKRQDDGVVSLGRIFGFQGDFSIAFTMKTPTGYQDRGAMLLGRHQAGSYNGYWFMVNSEWGYGAPNKLTFYYSNATVISTSDVNDGRWHAVAVSYSVNSGVELYIDGRLEAKGPPNPIQVPNVDFLIGTISWPQPQGTVTFDLSGLALFDRTISGSDAAYIAANPQWYVGQGWSQGWGQQPQQTGQGFFGNQNQQGGQEVSRPSTMRIVLKNGQVLSIPTSEILRIEF